MPNNTIYEWYQLSKQRMTELKEMGLHPPPSPPTTAKENAYTETYSFTLSKAMKLRLKNLTHQLGFRYMSETMRHLISAGGRGVIASEEVERQTIQRTTKEEKLFLEASFEFRGVLKAWASSGGDRKNLKEFQVQWEEPSYPKDELQLKALATEAMLGKKKWMN